MFIVCGAVFLDSVSVTILTAIDPYGNTSTPLEFPLAVAKRSWLRKDRHAREVLRTSDLDFKSDTDPASDVSKPLDILPDIRRRDSTLTRRLL